MSPFWAGVLIVLTVVPVVALSVFSIVDTVRRPDLSAATKVVWIAGIALVPLVGGAAYLIFRPTKPGDIRGFGRRGRRSSRFNELVPGGDEEDR
ncbi:MAG: PLDc_N domain-containing protein [bacterium]|nr:PLDc_N domain-containing protein [bacterium]MCP4965661.1 PLDc_N domain-containing protein [bacterium]